VQTDRPPRAFHGAGSASDRGWRGCRRYVRRDFQNASGEVLAWPDGAARPRTWVISAPAQLQFVWDSAEESSVPIMRELRRERLQNAPSQDSFRREKLSRKNSG